MDTKEHVNDILDDVLNFDDWIILDEDVESTSASVDTMRNRGSKLSPIKKSKRNLSSKSSSNSSLKSPSKFQMGKDEKLSTKHRNSTASTSSSIKKSLSKNNMKKIETSIKSKKIIDKHEKTPNSMSETRSTIDGEAASKKLRLTKYIDKTEKLVTTIIEELSRSTSEHLSEVVCNSKVNV